MHNTLDDMLEVSWDEVKVNDIVWIEGDLDEQLLPTACYGPHSVHSIKDKVLINKRGRKFPYPVGRIYKQLYSFEMQIVIVPKESRVPEFVSIAPAYRDTPYRFPTEMMAWQQVEICYPGIGYEKKVIRVKFPPNINLRLG